MSNVQLPMFNYQLLLAPPTQCIGQKTTPRGQFLWRRGVFPSLADFRKRGSSPFSRMSHVQRHRYSDAAMLLNVVLVAVPTELIAVKQTMTIKANMTAYSTAVGPSSETRKRCIFLASDFIGIPPFPFDSALRSRTGTTNFLGILGTRHRFRYDNRRRPAICLRDPMLVKKPTSPSSTYRSDSSSPFRQPGFRRILLRRPFALRTRPCGRFAFVEDERLQASCNANGPPVGQAHQTCIRQRTFRAGAAPRPPLYNQTYVGFPACQIIRIGESPPITGDRFDCRNYKGGVMGKRSLPVGRKTRKSLHG